MKKVAICAANGIGDGLLSMILSHNLAIKYHVTTFSNPLSEVTRWFPDKEIHPKPKYLNILDAFDLVIGTDHSFVRELKHPNLLILKHFNKKISMVENLLQFCERQFQMKATKDNGLRIPKDVRFKQFPKRIVIHPLSSDPKKNWPKEKFLNLAEKLKTKGFETVFCMADYEKSEWQNAAVTFKNLDECFVFIAESGYLIGNDSGLGHFASNIHLETLILFARSSYAKLWRPDWRRGKVVSPPNIFFGARLKQKYWKELLSEKKVLKNWEKNVFFSRIVN